MHLLLANGAQITSCIYLDIHFRLHKSFRIKLKIYKKMYNGAVLTPHTHTPMQNKICYYSNFITNSRENRQINLLGSSSPPSQKNKKRYLTTPTLSLPLLTNQPSRFQLLLGSYRAQLTN